MARSTDEASTRNAVRGSAPRDAVALPACAASCWRPSCRRAAPRRPCAGRAGRFPQFEFPADAATRWPSATPRAPSGSVGSAAGGQRARGRAVRRHVLEARRLSIPSEAGLGYSELAQNATTRRRSRSSTGPGRRARLRAGARRARPRRCSPPSRPVRPSRRSMPLLDARSVARAAAHARSRLRFSDHRGAGRRRRARRSSAAISSEARDACDAGARRRRPRARSCIASWRRSSVSSGSSTRRRARAEGRAALDDRDASAHTLIGEIENARGDLTRGLDA